MLFKIGMIVFPRGHVAPQVYRIADILQNGRIADLKPMSLGAVPLQTPTADLRRYRLRTTDEVSWNDHMATVVRVLNPRSEDVFQYELELDGGSRATAPEYELDLHEGSAAAEPAAMLAQLDLAPWKLVSARAQLLEAFFNATARSLGIVGYNGARMLPIPHQINAARYAIQFGRVRFLLADEVGLGKTIEAGLIASTLRKYFPDWSVGVFVPESLVAQWAFEMYGKFGKAVYAMDLAEYDPDAEAGVILPHYKAPEFAKDYAPEILIVDEAHRTLRTPKVVEALTRLSRSANAVLLLTATPVSDDAGNLLRLLQILDPEAFAKIASGEELRHLQRRQGAIEETLKAIRTADFNAAAVRRAWNSTGLQDAEIERHLATAEGGRATRHELHKMAALIVDRYYPGARMLRYRRKFLSQENAMPLRVFDAIAYKSRPEEDAVVAIMRRWLDALRDADLAADWAGQRLASSLIQAAYSSPLAVADWVSMRRGEMTIREGVTADPIRLSLRAGETVPPLAGEDQILADLDAARERWQRETREVDVTARALARSPRYEAFLAYLQQTFQEDPEAHVLVFTSFEANVHPLFLLVRKALQDVAEVLEMYGPQQRVEREKAAFEFQEAQGGCVLISDELGGEGRNFQFATHLLHYDLPLAPWMVEQRIGRCDRVGRDEELDVDSQVLVAKGGLDEVFCDFLAEGIGVFNDSIAPVEGELDDVMTRILTACIEQGPAGVLDEIEEVAEHLEAARERENAELLVRSAVGVEEARRVAELLRDDVELLALRKAVIRYARLFESMVDEQEGGRVAITVGEYHSLHAIPGVRSEMIGYFDRREAVRHERLEFFSPGHPFVRTLTQMTMVDSPDRAAIVERPALTTPAAVFRFRVALPTEFVERVRELPVDLQPPLLSKSSALFGTRMVTVVTDMDATVLDDPAVLEVVLSPHSDSDRSLDRGGAVIPGLPDDWDTRCLAMGNAAQEYAEELADALFQSLRGEFEDMLVEAMVRTNNDHDAAETDIEAVMELLAVLTVDLDSAVLFLPTNWRAPRTEARAEERDEEEEMMDSMLDNLDEED